MKSELFYVGCYTPSGEAGIRVVEFNNQTGAMNEINSCNEVTNTSFLAISKNKQLLLAVSEDEIVGELGCFNIANPCKPVFINKQDSLGGAPCHISVTNKNAFVSNYMSGNLSVFSLSDHQLPPAFTSVQHEGQGPNLDRQESAHIHSSQLSVNEKFLVVADLGIDALKVYKVRGSGLNLVFTATLAPGDGPRHFAFNQLGNKLYLGNELSSEVVVFDFNQQTGELVQQQRITSLRNERLNFSNKIAEVTLSQDGFYLYVSNRGDDSITSYSVDPISGFLTLLDNIKTGGIYPRHFAISPDQRWLLVAHQKSDYLSAFKRDTSTGVLSATNEQLHVKHGVCICFL